MPKIAFRKYVIYRIYNTYNNKSYIGKCQSGTARIFDHFKHYNNPKFEYRARLLYRAMNKYGSSFFNWEILAEAHDNKSLSDLEKFYIKKYNTRNREFGYNIRDGGDGGDTWAGLSEEDRKLRINKQLEAQKYMYENPEYKNNMSNKISRARSNYEAYSKNHKVCSDRMKKLNKNPNFRKTNNEYLCVETGEIFKSKKDLCNKYNLDYSNFNLNTKKRKKLGLTFKLIKHRIKKENPENAN